MLTAVTGCGDSVPHGESSDADWWPGVYCTPLYSTVLYTVHGHLSRLTWCRQVAASGVAPASARGPASATLAATHWGHSALHRSGHRFSDLIIRPFKFAPFLSHFVLDCWTAELLLI